MTDRQERRAFARDVCAGLQATPKTLPFQYLYDSLGSTLFTAITQLPEYGVLRAEMRLLHDHATDIAQASDAALVVELGSGDGVKTRPLMRAFLKLRPMRYRAIDVSAAALHACMQELANLPDLDARAIHDTYLDGLPRALHDRSDQPVMVALLGSSLGNFGRTDSLQFLQRIRSELLPGDSFLLGLDLLKPPEQLLAAYDDALGVTAAFNRNILARINRELDGNFQLPAFRHLVRFIPDSGDVQMHLQALQAQQVDIPGANCSVSFAQGETIHTETSHKFSMAEAQALAQQAGFAVTTSWRDESWQFASVLLRAVAKQE